MQSPFFKCFFTVPKLPTAMSITSGKVLSFPGTLSSYPPTKSLKANDVSVPSFWRTSYREGKND